MSLPEMAKSLAGVHLRKLILAGSHMMLTPLLLQGEVALEEVQRSADGIVPPVKEARAHPLIFEVIL
jgi:hypothetical protein